MNKNKYITIDGGWGEGGGQILRTSLSLSMCLGKEVVIKNIRSGRKKPGLMRQHLTCVLAAQEICDASVTGAELGSQEVRFSPGNIKAGKYKFSIGTAGSTSLVFQTILPALIVADKDSEVCFEGGTHNMCAPSFEFINKCFIETLKGMNITVKCKLNRYGFYPNGGGQWTSKISRPVDLKALQLVERGKQKERCATAFISQIPTGVSKRELDEVKRKLEWNSDEMIEKVVDSYGPGNLISLKLAYENTTQLFEAVAQRGLSAERVAMKAISKLVRYKNSSAVVGEYLADQLLIPMVLTAGGSFVTHVLSAHAKTNLDVIHHFLKDTISVKKLDDDLFEVVVRGVHLAS